MTAYQVDYFNEHTDRWNTIYSPIMPTKYKTEAERLAIQRSKGSVRTFRVRKGRDTVSHWKAGKEITIARLT